MRPQPSVLLLQAGWRPDPILARDLLLPRLLCLKVGAVEVTLLSLPL